MFRTTPQERQALGVTALLLIAGAGVRVLSAPEGAVEWVGGASDTLVVSALGEVRQEAERELERERIRTRPLSDGERLDPNRADVLQLDRLPRVGEALATRIVEWREEHGAFRSLGDLDSVPGIGPALLQTMEPFLELPRKGPVAGGAGAGAEAPLTDLNRATDAQLQRLPGIGPALAARIVAHRTERGPFASVDELEQVPGIGSALLERLAPLVTVGR